MTLKKLLLTSALIGGFGLASTNLWAQMNKIITIRPGTKGSPNDRILLLERAVAELQWKVHYLQQQANSGNQVIVPPLPGMPGANPPLPLPGVGQPNIPPPGLGGQPALPPPGMGGAPARRSWTCSLTTSFGDTFLGKGTTRVEAEAKAKQACAKSPQGGMICEHRTPKCEQES